MSTDSFLLPSFLASFSASLAFRLRRDCILVRMWLIRTYLLSYSLFPLFCKTAFTSLLSTINCRLGRILICVPSLPSQFVHCSRSSRGDLSLSSTSSLSSLNPHSLTYSSPLHCSIVQNDDRQARLGGFGGRASSPHTFCMSQIPLEAAAAADPDLLLLLLKLVILTRTGRYF